MRKNLFIKVSGDLCMTLGFMEYLRTVTAEYFTVICVGGGTQINDELLRRGIQPGVHGPLGRELVDFDSKQMARDILEKNQAQLQDALARLKINAIVTIPVLDIGSVLCHVNGDEMVKVAYLGFDRLVVVTKPDRVADKQKTFVGLPKIEIRGIE